MKEVIELITSIATTCTKVHNVVFDDNDGAFPLLSIFFVFVFLFRFIQFVAICCCHWTCRADCVHCVDRMQYYDDDSYTIEPSLRKMWCDYELHKTAQKKSSAALIPIPKHKIRLVTAIEVKVLDYFTSHQFCYFFLFRCRCRWQFSLTHLCFIRFYVYV